MLAHRRIITRTIGLLAVLLAWIGSMSSADDGCAPKTCCPVPTTKKTTHIVYGENVQEVCFPPTPCMRLKKCLGLVPDSGCDGCCGSPRKVHKLTLRTVTEEKCTTTYEPTVLCPHDACPVPAAPGSPGPVR